MRALRVVGTHGNARSRKILVVSKGSPHPAKPVIDEEEMKESYRGEQRWPEARCDRINLTQDGVAEQKDIANATSLMDAERQSEENNDVDELPSVDSLSFHNASDRKQNKQKCH